MGWAFANGEHITKEHLIVYWLAPVEGTLAAVWLFRILAGPKKDEAVAAKKDNAPQLMKCKNSDVVELVNASLQTLLYLVLGLDVVELVKLFIDQEWCISDIVVLSSWS
ncbi:UNVERIFIED_CONTAM: putative aquaporin SIP2-1 [Sesamum radiatum]|uniref:Aquaporin SIP2-1 n=1 Tax=Sesamum radiatum TaxID=300843 RepID=A0AAW2NU00_SESRA